VGPSIKIGKKWAESGIGGGFNFDGGRRFNFGDCGGAPLAAASANNVVELARFDDIRIICIWREGTPRTHRSTWRCQERRRSLNPSPSTLLLF